MIIMMEKSATEEQVQKVLSVIIKSGNGHHLSPLERSVIISVDNKIAIDEEQFKAFGGVRKVLGLDVELPKPN